MLKKWKISAPRRIRENVRWRQTVPPVSNAAAQDLVVCEHFVQCAQCAGQHISVIFVIFKLVIIMNVSGIKVYIFWLFVTLSITVIPFCRFGSRTVERNGGNVTRRRWRPPREGRMGEGIMWKVGFQFLLLLCNLTP